MNTKENRNKVAKSISLQATTVKKVEEAKDLCDEYDFSYRVDTIINSYFSLMAYTKLELKGVFTENEAGLLVDCLNGYISSYQINPVVSLHSKVVDSMDLNHLGEKWDVNKVTLSDKLIKLTAAQAECVVGLTVELWNRCDLDGTQPDISSIFLF